MILLAHADAVARLDEESSFPFPPTSFIISCLEVEIASRCWRDLLSIDYSSFKHVLYLCVSVHDLSSFTILDKSQARGEML